MQQQSHAKETRMPLVDLHSHSHYSDGSLAPADLVALAARAGITMLALTDHDSVAGLAEDTWDLVKGQGLRASPGAWRYSLSA